MAILTFFPMRLPRYARNDINRMRLQRFARNDGLPRPFRARNDIVIIYIAFILVYPSQADVENRTDL